MKPWSIAHGKSIQVSEKIELYAYIKVDFDGTICIDEEHKDFRIKLIIDLDEYVKENTAAIIEDDREINNPTT